VVVALAFAAFVAKPALAQRAASVDTGNVAEIDRGSRDRGAAATHAPRIVT
jgi:hypothetical protein